MISQKCRACGSSSFLIREMAGIAEARAAVIGAENVFNFTIGNPSITPPACVRETMERLLRTEDPIRLHSYAPAPGLAEVREKVAARLKETFGVPYRMTDIFVTDGASTALTMSLHALLSEGDEAIVLAPYFSEYKVYIEDAGAKVVEVRTAPDTFEIDPAALSAAMTEKTALLILNSPCNPSGTVFSEACIRGIAALLEEKQKEYGHPIFIIADEPYRELVYGGVKVPFVPAVYRNTLYCYSFSKSLSIPGDRVGYLALTPGLDWESDLRAALAGAGRAMGYVCTSSFAQRVAAECLGKTADISLYEENRDLIYNALLEMGYSCARPDGAFYLFLKTPDPDSAAFCRRAMEEHDLFLVPGEEFGYPGYARLAYCTTKQTLERSLPVFRKIAAEYGLKK